MAATFFETQAEFRTWLEANYKEQTELVVGFYKVNSGKTCMTWSESVDQALCFGWIDGIRKSIDAESYCIRFTPRRGSSVWSPINIKKVEELTKAGLMTEEGLKAFELMNEKRNKLYYPDKELVALLPDYEEQFKGEEAAWDFFKEQAPSYQKVMIHWIMSAKQVKTQQERLSKLMSLSKEKKRMR